MAYSVSPVFETDTASVYVGEASTVLTFLEAGSFDSVLTVPPDMPDDDGVEAWSQMWAGQLLRVLKSGAHLVVFGGTSQGYRVACGLARAGFQIRDTIAWLHATGLLFPVFEPVWLVRKPVEGSIVANVLKYGTGGLNINAARFNSGRWPVNVALDQVVALQLDIETGTRWSSVRCSDRFPVFSFDEDLDPLGYLTQPTDVHETVCSVSLLRWLARMVTPKNGVLLDPLTTDGAVVEAGLLEGFQVVAIAPDESALPLIRQRIERATGQA